jgi:twitching motility protein PilT
VVAVEVLVASDGVRNLLRRGLNHQLPAQMAMGRQAGSITLDLALARLVREGKISREQGLRRATHPEEFEGFLR